MQNITTATPTEHQVRLTVPGQLSSAGTFEVLCITAGKGNGWHFSAQVLQASLGLWEGVHCFIDHAWFSRSVRDLAGQVVHPAWDLDAKGIRATLQAFGPGGDLLTAYGREILHSDKPPRIGFSADILFTASGKTVTEITRVLSLDLVYDPARGGAFIRALNSLTRPQDASDVCRPQERLARLERIQGETDVTSPHRGEYRPQERLARLEHLQDASDVCRPQEGSASLAMSDPISGKSDHNHSTHSLLKGPFTTNNSPFTTNHSPFPIHHSPNIERKQPMPEDIQPTQPETPQEEQPARSKHAAERAPILEKLQEDQKAMRLLLDEHERLAELDHALEAANRTRVQMCAFLLDSGLATSKLPKPIQARIRKQFEGTVFEAAELIDVINDHRDMLSELSAGQTVAGPGRITSVFNERDKLQAAVDDLFEAPRDEKLQGLSVPRLTGVRELYLMLTGDHDLHGGFHPDRVQLATTADFTGLVKNALNKLVMNQWTMLGRAGYDWWKQITVQEHFHSIQDITGTLIGTVGDLPVVAEGAEYTELLVGDSPETASFVKYGGYIPLTLELIDRDQTRKLKAYARELGSAGIRKISKLVAEIFTAASGTGPLMADGGRLFNATAVTTAGGHANLLTTALAIAAWDAACGAVYNQPMLIKNEAGLYGTGPKMAINPKFCLVPRTLQNTAWQMLKGEFVREQNYVYDNVLKGSAVPITVPEWTDVNDWGAVCDPNVAPAIFVGERFGLMPEIYVAGDELSPAVFMNDEHRLKVRHFLAVWVNDFRPLHKSNVA